MGKPKIEMAGNRFFRWTVLSVAEKTDNQKATGLYWNCVCDCGTNAVVFGTTLRGGNSKSCGCWKAEKSAIAMKAMRIKKAGTIEERFFARFVKKESGCWQWNAHADKDGYGLLPGVGTSKRAHRFSYEHHIGPIPAGFLICHSCDNPGCVNPEHLFLGTAKDNAIDARNKHRHYIGTKNIKAKLSDNDVIYIKTSDKKRIELANLFGVSVATIKSIKLGKTWKHLF